MQLLEIGKLFKEGKTKYKEGCVFDITDSGANLIFYYTNPTEKEIRNITKERVQYGYYRENALIMMLFKFGDENWIDSPYSVHFSSHLTSNISEITEGTGLAVNVYLVDAATGILKGMRLIGLSTRVSNMLKNDIEMQREMPAIGFENDLRNIYSKYSTKDLVKLAKVIDKI